MLLTTQAVTTLLTKAGLQADSDYIAKIVSAVVAILNAQQAEMPVSSPAQA